MGNLKGWIAIAPCSQGYMASIGLDLFTFSSFLSSLQWQRLFAQVYLQTTVILKVTAGWDSLTIWRTKIQKHLIRGILKANILLKRRGWCWLLLIPFAKVQEPEKCHPPPVNLTGWLSSSLLPCFPIFLTLLSFLRTQTRWRAWHPHSTLFSHLSLFQLKKYVARHWARSLGHTCEGWSVFWEFAVLFLTWLSQIH